MALALASLVVFQAPGAYLWSPLRCGMTVAGRLTHPLWARLAACFYRRLYFSHIPVFRALADPGTWIAANAAHFVDVKDAAAVAAARILHAAVPAPAPPFAAVPGDLPREFSIDAGAPPAPNTALEPLVTCPICLELMSSPAITQCGHTFCRGCIDAALLRSPLCPACRVRITASELRGNYSVGGYVDQVPA